METINLKSPITAALQFESAVCMSILRGSAIIASANLLSPVATKLTLQSPIELEDTDT